MSSIHVESACVSVCLHDRRYNVVIGRHHKKVSEPPKLHSLPPIMPYLETWCAMDRYGQDGIARPEDRKSKSESIDSQQVVPSR